jgi:hypothetical protein
MLSSTYINNSNPINTNNTNNNNNNNNNKETITIQLPKSVPIPIPVSMKQKNNNIDEYSLNCNNFNPSKMSPPNIWKNRLIQRLESYNNITFLNE